MGSNPAGRTIPSLHTPQRKGPPDTGRPIFADADKSALRIAPVAIAPGIAAVLLAVLAILLALLTIAILMIAVVLIGISAALLAILIGYLTTRSRLPLVRRLGQ